MRLVRGRAAVSRRGLPTPLAPSDLSRPSPRFHSHPFDTNALDESLGKDDHCWFSQIDVQNQLQWQNAFEMMDGIPFVGIVVDPKTSVARRRLVMRAFRNYSDMATYDPGTVMPDGKPEPFANYAFERWGSAWKNYYEVPV